MSDETQIEEAEPVVAEAPVEPAEQLAEEPIELAPEAGVDAPTEVSAEVTPETPASTMARVEIWLAETKYFFSTLDHEVTGPAGELIAYIKARL